MKNFKYNKMIELEIALKKVYDQANPEVVQNWLLGISQETQVSKIHSVNGCHDCGFCHHKPTSDSEHNNFKPVCFWDGSNSNLIQYLIAKSKPESCPLLQRSVTVQNSL